MIEMIIGGSSSGKSEYAENCTVELCMKENESQLVYIATMLPYGKETKEKIQRHREMRKEKNFVTIECFTDLKKIDILQGSTVLLDCISNLVANEMFREDAVNENIVFEIIEGIKLLKDRCKYVVIVTNDIFLEGYLFEETTIEYMRCLAKVNQAIMALSDKVIEVVCGIPITIK